MSAPAPPPPRVAVLFAGDASDPSAWSGTPYGVLIGLREVGVEVVAVDVRVSATAERLLALALAPLHQRGGAGRPVFERIKRGYSAALVGGDVARLRSRVAQRRLRRIGAVDGIVQIGAGYEVEASSPRVVYDDMTVAQALDLPYPSWQALRRRDASARLALQRRVYGAVTACCMMSSWAGRSAVEHLDVPSDQVRVVGAGTHDVVRHVDRSWEVPRFLFVGLDFERKNGPRVLRAFARLHERHPYARLDVVGLHPPIDQPGVVTHGRISRDTEEGGAALTRLFDLATCFVMPSLHEPAGLVFAEAAAAGLPSIGGDRGGSVDLIGDGGVVVDPLDDDALLSAMLRLADPAEAARVGAVAADRSPQLTWAALSGRLLRALGLPFADTGAAADFLPFRLSGP